MVPDENPAQVWINAGEASPQVLVVAYKQQHPKLHSCGGICNGPPLLHCTLLTIPSTRQLLPCAGAHPSSHRDNPQGGGCCTCNLVLEASQRPVLVDPNPLQLVICTLLVRDVCAFVHIVSCTVDLGLNHCPPALRCLLSWQVQACRRAWTSCVHSSFQHRVGAAPT
jgi:hypothetical protein